MIIRTMALLLAVSAASAQANHNYPNFYKNVNHISPYKNALVNDDWYMPTAQQRSMISALLSMDLSQSGMEWKVNQIVYDPNFYEGIKQVGSETACLLYRYLKGQAARTSCEGRIINEDRVESIPFASKYSQHYRRPLVIDSPQKPSSDDDLRYEFWIPAGIDYKTSKHYYPIQKLGHNTKGADKDALVVNAFLSVYQSDNGKWKKLKISNSPIVLPLKLPSQQEIKKNKSAQQAYRQAAHLVRILDFRE